MGFNIGNMFAVPRFVANLVRNEPEAQAVTTGSVQGLPNSVVPEQPGYTGGYIGNARQVWEQAQPVKLVQDPYMQFITNLQRRADNRHNMLRAYLTGVQKQSPGSDFTGLLANVGDLSDAYLQSAIMLPRIQELLSKYEQSQQGGGSKSLAQLLSDAEAAAKKEK